MLSHVVMFTLKDEAQVPRALNVLRAMEGRIPGLRSIEVGADTLPSKRSAHLVLITRFDNVESLQSYQTHPVHQEVLSQLAGIVHSAVKVDFIR